MSPDNHIVDLDIILSEKIVDKSNWHHQIVVILPKPKLSYFVQMCLNS